jgi:hypothetical protein
LAGTEFLHFFETIILLLAKVCPPVADKTYITLHSASEDMIPSKFVIIVNKVARIHFLYPDDKL